MSFYWVQFEDRGPATIAATDPQDALKIAKEETDETPTEANQLPYPAKPRINTEHPAFCYKPRTCQGNSSCPRSPACSS